MADPLTVYQQNIICHDNVEEENFIHKDIWKPFVYGNCPDENPDHTYQDSVITSIVSSSIVSITQDSDKTGGKYRNQEFDFSVPAGPSTDYPVASIKTFPYNIRIAAYEFIPTDENVGDSFSIYVVPPTPVGILTQSIDDGNDIIVNSDVLNAISLGVEVILDDGVNVQNLGECVNIDLDTSTITVEETISFSFSASTPVKLRFPIAKHIRILNTKTIKFGNNMPGNKFIAEGLEITLCYNNPTENSKHAYLRAEMFI